MPIQRACGAENQAGDNTSNGPPRVQSNAGKPAEYSATQGMRQLPGMCWHPAKRMGVVPMNRGGTAKTIRPRQREAFPLPGTFCMDLNAQEGRTMNFTPQLSEVRAIAAEKKYDVVPISCEICALMPGRLQSAA